MLEGTAIEQITLPATWVEGTLQCKVQVFPSTLAELQKAGKITRRVGRGTIVTAPADGHRGAAMAQLLDASPVELLEFRLAMEPGLAEAITLNASEGDLQAIMACVVDGFARLERKLENLRG